MRTEPDPKDDDPLTPLTERVREDIGELAQRAAQEMIDEADERERREQNTRHTPEAGTERECFYCLVHYRIDMSVGRSWYEAHTIDPMPYGLRPLMTVAPSADRAVRRMHWIYALALMRVGHDELEARRKAARATFIQAEVIR